MQAKRKPAAFRKTRMQLRAPLAACVCLLLFFLQAAAFAQSEPDTSPRSMISGRVVSRYGPVENARVREPGNQNYALTDKFGRFLLQSAHSPGRQVRITAGKEGWFNNDIVTRTSKGSEDIYLNPVYLNDQAGYSFVSPATCSRCHVKLTRVWDKSKMAHTTSNSKVHDLFYGTDARKRAGVAPGFRLDNPRSNGNCIECHAPSVAASTPWSQDLKSALNSQLAEWDGISCDFCHKIRKVIPAKDKSSGMAPVLERQSAPGSPSILVFGPYDDVVVGPMAASYNPVFDQGRYCSICHSHSVRLPGEESWKYGKVYSASEWKGFGFKDGRSIPIQTTYQEWKQWQDQLAFDDPNKGKKCQDCHMNWRKEMLPYDNYVVDGGARRMWGTHRSAQDIRPHHLEGGTQKQLKTALSMELEGDIDDERLTVTVYVTNTNGGHWVPTGETMRSVILLVQGFDSTGKPLKRLSGPILPEWAGEGPFEEGNYGGLPGAVFARALRDDQGNINVPFWRATGVAFDTRIRPKKMVELQFAFALEDPDDEPVAEAKLIYRPVIKPWAEKKQWDIEDILITAKVW